MKKYQLTLLSLCVAAFAQAKVTLPSFFTDNMVIQQNSQLTLPGKAKAGKQVTVKVSWNYEKYTAKASADGHFSIEVPTPPAGGPFQITVSDGEKLVLNNVLSGEVWICSGQSNMEMPVAGWGKVMNYEQEVADADYPSIRLLQVKKTVAFSPQDNVEMNMNGWQECSSATVPEFSSVAYFYARKLWKELNVPVGVIDCTWGGTPAESWTSHQTLKQVMGFQKKMAEMESAGFQREKLVELYHQEMDEWLQQFDARDAGFKDGVPQWISALQTGNGWKPMELPAYWETRGLNFDGTVWFQKEVEIPADWSGKEISFHLAMIDDDDEVVGMICVEKDVKEDILVVSENGYGKRTDLDDYRITNRGGKGVKTLQITEKTGKLIAIKSVTDENDLMIINKSGLTIRIPVGDIRLAGRATQGVKVINLRNNDAIASVVPVPKSEEDNDSEAGVTEESGGNGAQPTADASENNIE